MQKLNNPTNQISGSDVTGGWELGLESFNKRKRPKKITASTLTATTTPKPLSNELASRRKSTEVFDLRSTCFWIRHPLALTLVELRFVRKSTQDFHRLATQRAHRKCVKSKTFLRLA